MKKEFSVENHAIVRDDGSQTDRALVQTLEQRVRELEAAIESEGEQWRRRLEVAVRLRESAEFKFRDVVANVITTGTLAVATEKKSRCCWSKFQNEIGNSIYVSVEETTVGNEILIRIIGPHSTGEELLTQGEARQLCGVLNKFFGYSGVTSTSSTPHQNPSSGNLDSCPTDLD